MTVKELIEQLQKCNQGKRVYLPNWHHGYCEIQTSQELNIVVKSVCNAKTGVWTHSEQSVVLLDIK
jgi:hypothetical protein